MKDQGQGRLSLSSISFLEYLPRESRNEPELEAWYPQISGISQGTADDVLAHLPSGDETDCNVLDVGANVGTFTEQIASARKDCKIVGFEPIEELYSFNYDKHKDNPQMKLENLALCDSKGAQTIYRSKTGNLGWNTQEMNPAGLSPEEIQCTTFDEYAEQEGLMGTPISALKIDVEGAEWRVLRGMHDFIKSLGEKLPVIAMEIGFGKEKHPHWEEEKKELEWLFANGYKRTNYEFEGTRDVVLVPE